MRLGHQLVETLACAEATFASAEEMRGDPKADAYFEMIETEGGERDVRFLFGDFDVTSFVASRRFEAGLPPTWAYRDQMRMLDQSFAARPVMPPRSRNKAVQDRRSRNATARKARRRNRR